mmetsp:Transcript_41503/g.93588  ORF Transcript_41503/g.93588 Transcript_41503/m.93588 type:complete len:249 (+) Transcript_41503:172-918(+)
MHGGHSRADRWETRKLGSVLECQRSPRPLHDRRGREGGAHQAGDDPGGAHVREHGHRAGLHRARAGLQVRADYARDDERRAPNDAARAWGRGGADSQGDGGGGRPRQSQGNPRPTWRPGLHASAVREPCQSQGAPRDDGPRDLARHGGRRGGVRERRRDGRHGHGGLAVHQGLPRARNRAKEPKPLHGGGGAGGANALDGGARRGEDRGARAAQNPGHGRRNRPASARPRSRGRGGPGAQRGGDGHDL